MHLSGDVVHNYYCRYGKSESANVDVNLLGWARMVLQTYEGPSPVSHMDVTCMSYMTDTWRCPRLNTHTLWTACGKSSNMIWFIGFTQSLICPWSWWLAINRLTFSLWLSHWTDHAKGSCSQKDHANKDTNNQPIFKALLFHQNIVETAKSETSSCIKSWAMDSFHMECLHSHPGYSCKTNTKFHCTMAVNFSSLAGKSSPSGGNLPHAATSGGSNFCHGGSSKSSGFEMMKNQMKLCFATLFTTNDKVNSILILSKVLEMAQLYNPNAYLKSSKTAVSPITSVNKIPKDEVFDYAFDLQCLATKKQFVFFAILKTNISFNTLKFNSAFFSWLLKNKYLWASTHWTQTIPPLLVSSLASIPHFPVVTTWKNYWIPTWMTSSIPSCPTTASSLIRRASISKPAVSNSRSTLLKPTLRITALPLLGWILSSSKN